MKIDERLKAAEDTIAILRLDIERLYSIAQRQARQLAQLTQGRSAAA